MKSVYLFLSGPQIVLSFILKVFVAEELDEGCPIKCKISSYLNTPENEKFYIDDDRTITSESCPNLAWGYIYHTSWNSQNQRRKDIILVDKEINGKENIK